MLGFNQLTGSIPSELGGLEKLTTLDLSSNHLSGEIPLSIIKLVNLGNLDLGYNNLTSKNTTVVSYLAQKDKSWKDTQEITNGSNGG
jgi:Leucine-rich repeat (LRR) protein